MSLTQNHEEIPPFYLEVFYRLDGRHNRPYQFEPKEKALLHNKLELYFWRDSSLKEITDKISETIPFEEAKIPGTKYKTVKNRIKPSRSIFYAHFFLTFFTTSK